MVGWLGCWWAQSAEMFENDWWWSTPPKWAVMSSGCVRHPCWWLHLLYHPFYTRVIDVYWRFSLSMGTPFLAGMSKEHLGLEQQTCPLQAFFVYPPVPFGNGESPMDIYFSCEIQKSGIFHWCLEGITYLCTWQIQPGLVTFVAESWGCEAYTITYVTYGRGCSGVYGMLSVSRCDRYDCYVVWGCLRHFLLTRAGDIFRILGPVQMVVSKYRELDEAPWSRHHEQCGHWLPWYWCLKGNKVGHDQNISLTTLLGLSQESGSLKTPK